MDVADLRELHSPRGVRALADAVALEPTEASYLNCAARLRPNYGPALARAALDTALLRRKAAGKFPHAAAMFFTREALEVASDARVSRHRAARFRGMVRVGDFGCGLGSDALALAEAGCWVEAVDFDPLRAAMTEANAAACGLADRVAVTVADLLNEPLPEVDAAFADPGRRAGVRRFLRLDDYLPPPEKLLARLPYDLPVAFKLAPGVAPGDLDSFDGEIEFVSLDGELKEACLWLRAFRTTRRRATVLVGNATHSLTAEKPALATEAMPIRAVLLDPDPAVVRAGLVPNLGELLKAGATDDTVQMLTADAAAPTPYATRYQVDCVLPFDVKRVGAELLRRGVGRVTLVNRGSLADVAAIQKKWKLKGNLHRFVVLTRERGRQVAVIADRA